MKLRQHTRGRSRIRALKVLAWLPLELFVTITDNFPPPGEPVPSLITAFAPFLVLWESGGDIRGAISGDPIMVYGKVVEIPECGSEALSQALYKRMLGHDLVLDVERAVRIARDGSMTEYTELLGCKKELGATREVTSHVKVGEKVILLCNSVGRALAVGPEISDPAFASIFKDFTSKER
jgi:hypothetical protein